MLLFGQGMWIMVVCPFQTLVGMQLPHYQHRCCTAADDEGEDGEQRQRQQQPSGQVPPAPQPAAPAGRGLPSPVPAGLGSPLTGLGSPLGPLFGKAGGRMGGGWSELVSSCLRACLHAW